MTYEEELEIKKTVSELFIRHRASGYVVGYLDEGKFKGTFEFSAAPLMSAIMKVITNKFAN